MCYFSSDKWDGDPHLSHHIWGLQRLARIMYVPGKTTGCVDSCIFLVFFP